VEVLACCVCSAYSDDAKLTKPVPNYKASDTNCPFAGCVWIGISKDDEESCAEEDCGDYDANEERPAFFRREMRVSLRHSVTVFASSPLQSPLLPEDACQRLVPRPDASRPYPKD